MTSIRRRTSRVWLPTILLVVLASLLVASCGQAPASSPGSSASSPSAATSTKPGASEPAKKELVTLEVADTSAASTSGLPILAMGKGYDVEEGIKIVRKTFASSAPLGEAVASGAAPFGQMEGSTFASLKSSGVPIKILSQSVDSTQSIQLLVRKDLNVQKAEDLYGKTVGFPFGSGAQALWAQFVARYKLDRSKVQEIDLTPDNVVSAYSRGDIQAFVLWPPTLIKSMSAVPSTLLHDGRYSYVGGNKVSDPIVGTHIVVWANEKFIAEHPDLVKAYLRAAKKAAAFVSDPKNQDEAITILSTALKAERNTVDQPVKEWFFYKLTVDQTMVDDVYNTSQFFFKEGKMKAAPPEKLAGWLDLKFLKEVDPSQVKIAD